MQWATARFGSSRLYTSRLIYLRIHILFQTRWSAFCVALFGYKRSASVPFSFFFFGGKTFVASCIKKKNVDNGWNLYSFSCLLEGDPKKRERECGATSIRLREHSPSPTVQTNCFSSFCFFGLKCVLCLDQPSCFIVTYYSFLLLCDNRCAYRTNQSFFNSLINVVIDLLLVLLIGYY